MLRVEKLVLAVQNVMKTNQAKEYKKQDKMRESAKIRAEKE